MGNRIIKRKRAKPYDCQQDINGKDEEQTQDFDTNDEVTADSYDKLVSWMMEMAENDGENLISPSEFGDKVTNPYAENENQSKDNSELSVCSTSDIGETCTVRDRKHSIDSNSSRPTRSSQSGEDITNPKTRFRRAMLSRQSTVDYSDNSDANINTSFENNNESLCLLPAMNNVEETSFTNRLRPPLRKHQSCTTYRNHSTSISDLLMVHSRNKSKSLVTMRKVLSETRNDDEITPLSDNNVEKIFDDEMLDRNMADILYSVEALWPKYHKISK